MPLPYPRPEVLTSPRRGTGDSPQGRGVVYSGQRRGGAWSTQVRGGRRRKRRRVRAGRAGGHAAVSSRTSLARRMQTRRAPERLLRRKGGVRKHRCGGAAPGRSPPSNGSDVRGRGLPLVGSSEGMNPTRPGAPAPYFYHTRRDVGFPSMGMSRPGSRHRDVHKQAEKVNVARARSKYSTNFRRQAEAHDLKFEGFPRRVSVPQSRAARATAIEDVLRFLRALAVNLS